jgi:hypothetical protein
MKCRRIEADVAEWQRVISAALEDKRRLLAELQTQFEEMRPVGPREG